MKIKQEYENCKLCPRGCGANRVNGDVGACGVTAELQIARAALHQWEEPCISGENGSGTVFFAGCSLGCIYCQNQEISRGKAGKKVTQERLVEIFLELQEKGAHNINLVTGGHYVHHLVRALTEAKKQGLSIPVVYNTSSYETVESLARLEGLVDIYLADLKYTDNELACEYSKAKDYPDVAKAAIAEMVRQQPNCVFAGEEGDSLMKKGVIVRQLLLPGALEDAKQCTRYLYETYGNAIYISFMSQYTPMEQVKNHPHLSKTIDRKEYEAWLDEAMDYGVEQGFLQEEGVALESFIPHFDGEGV